ncbi:phosphate ABC transporter permease PstA [Bacteroides sp. CAG:545]|nr:phosphate ABC transporter permease PstA [Bacteroides sp. CAG:545]
MAKLKSKFIEENIFRVLMWMCVGIVLLVVLSIVWTIFVKGFGSISWEMIFQVPGQNWNTSDDGGFLNAILGSLMVVAPATVLAMFISVPVVFYMNLYRRRSNWLSYLARLVYDVLYGIPSIVYGAFAFMVMVMVGMRASVLGGIIVSTLLIIPMFIRSGDEISKSVPDDMIDAAYSLGATKLETLRVVLKQVLPGMATATLLAGGEGPGGGGRFWRWERPSVMLRQSCLRLDFPTRLRIHCPLLLRLFRWRFSTG